MITTHTTPVHSVLTRKVWPSAIAACVLAFSLLTATFTSAGVFMYVDENGVVNFTDTPPPDVNARKIVDSPSSTGKKSDAAEKPARKEAPTRSSASATPAECGGHPISYCNRVIHNASDRHGVDPLLVRAVVKAESNYNPAAVSNKGAQGIMQLMPQTANDMAVRDAFDIEDNVEGGVKYLRYLIGRFRDVNLAVAAYNAGPGAVEKYGGTPPYPETQQYVRRVFDTYKTLKSSRENEQTIYRIVMPDGTLMFTNMPSEYSGRGEPKQGQDL